MILLKNVIFQVTGQGCSLISASIIKFNSIIPLAKGRTPSQTVTQNTAPWGIQQGFLHGGFESAANLHNRGADQFFPGQTYATFSPQTEQALNLTEQRALAGSPVQGAMNRQLMATLGGDYLKGGPGFNAAYQAAANRIIPDIESRFAKSGRYGSGLARQAEASALGDVFAKQYGDERQNQLRAMLFAPQAAQADYNDLRALAAVGTQREGQAQSAIDEAIARHNFAQDEGWNRLAKYMNMIQGNYGQTSSQTTTGFPGNRGAGILGGAIGAGSLASIPALGLGPLGVGLGALGGGLLGSGLF